MIASLIRRVRRNDDLRNIARNGSVLYVAGGLSVVLTLVQQVATARYLGAVDYGRLAAALGYVLLLVLFVDVRTWELGTRLIATPLDGGSFQEVSRRFSWLVAAELALGVVGASIAVALAVPISAFVLETEARGLLWALSIVVPFRLIAAGVSVSILRLLDRYRWLSLRSVFTAVVRLVSIAGPAALGWGTQAVAIGIVLAEAVAALSIVVLAAYALRERSGSPAFDFRRPTCLVEARRLARQLWVSASIKGLHIESFIPVAAAFTSPAQIGVLRTGLDIGNVMTHATAPVGMVVGPRIVLLAQRERRKEVEHYLSLVRRVLPAVVVPTLAVSVPLVGFVLPAVLGQEFVSVRAVSILLLVGLAMSVSTLWVRHLLVGLDRVPDQNRLGLIAGVTSLLALPPLTSRWGAFGAALDLSLFLTIYSWMSVRIATRALDESQ